ncbi:MAG: MAPEG family protein [Chloroflexales bacterium]|nr:MAPEG family protein [Chloroflexales bacterium]
MPLLIVPVTALYAGFLALLAVILAMIVIRLRWRFKVGVGDGGNRDMARAVRVHGNAIEYIPIFLVLMAVFELNHGQPLVLHVIGALFLLGRVLHAWGLYQSGGSSPPRMVGTVLTLTLIIVLAVFNIIKVSGKVLLG